MPAACSIRSTTAVAELAENSKASPTQNAPAAVLTRRVRPRFTKLSIAAVQPTLKAGITHAVTIGWPDGASHRAVTVFSREVMPFLATAVANNIGGYSMSHFSKSKDAILKRVRRIAGQVSAIERALEADQDCAATLQLVAATKGAIGGLMEEILEDHLREHVAHPDLTPADRAQGAEELLAVIRRYAK